MGENIKIVGCYQTKYCARDNSVSLPELVFECSRGLLDRYGLERSDIDLLVIAAMICLTGDVCPAW